MTTRGIVCSAHEVRGLPKGAVSLLVRPIKTEIVDKETGPIFRFHKGSATQSYWIPNDPAIRDTSVLCREQCPFGKPGDRLWVKETWQRKPLFGGPKEVICYRSDLRQWDILPLRVGFPVIENNGGLMVKDVGPWSSATQLPRWASRLTLQLSEVRVMRVQEISAEDLVACGVENALAKAMWGDRWWVGAPEASVRDTQKLLAKLYDEKHGPGAWDRNDWVWLLSVSVVPQDSKESE